MGADGAAEVARKCGAPLRVVDVMSASAKARRALREDLEDELMARRREKLARLAYGLRDVVAETDILAWTQLELRRGRVDSVLPEFVVAEGVDLAVMGTRGRTGIARHLRGNTVERLLDRLPCSLVAVKPATAAASIRADASA